jgi:hypothetical protein
VLLMLKRCVHVVDAALYRVSDPNGDCFSPVSQVTALGLPPGPAYRKLKEGRGGTAVCWPQGFVALFPPYFNLSSIRHNAHSVC